MFEPVSAGDAEMGPDRSNTGRVARMPNDAMTVIIGLPKKALGEDADPVVGWSANDLWMGVFDGMGGAGATAYDTVNGQRTGAYLASRIAAQTFAGWVDEHSYQLDPDNRRDTLHDAMHAAFASARDELDAEPSRIRGKLFRTLPTTAAVLGITCDENEGMRFCAIWAGDSRIFVLRPRDGLTQVSHDHIKAAADAQQNLSTDSALSNCINADAPFYLDQVLLEVELPAIGIVATDGCFGYFESPLLFEYHILRSLAESASPNEMACRLGQSIQSVTGDDASMVAAMVGWDSFADARDAYARRLGDVKICAEKLQAASSEVASAEYALRSAEEARRLVRQSIWTDYRRTYEPRSQPGGLPS